MTARRNYIMPISITNATETEAQSVQSEIAGAIEDARDSGVWNEPVTVSWGEIEPVMYGHDAAQQLALVRQLLALDATGAAPLDAGMMNLLARLDLSIIRRALENLENDHG